MLKDKLAALIGKENYVNYVMYLTKVYHAFFKIRHPAAPIIKKYLIPKNGTVIDVGAHIGAFTSFASQIVGPCGKVFSFEPVPMVLRVLRTVVKLRRLHQVKIVEAALAEKNGSFEITVPLKDGWKPMLPLAYLGNDKSAETLVIKIEGKRLDDFCESEKLGKIDFIKCDTEGAEFSVFAGGVQTLTKHLPSVLCEIYEDYLARQKVTPKDIFKIFTDLGYNCFLIKPSGTLTRVAGYIRRADYLFVHPSKALADSA
jgi:FkbM family methyltransferase